ncbi:MAG: DUF4097 family beta strand repeat-containing protein [candidate division WOR-3 bacterium]|nr:DUF4097 family beta strand repeat-containing protein [candidate division WOR-3 bacterium]
MMSVIATLLITAQVVNPSVSIMVPNALFGFFEKTEEFRETYEVPSGTKLQVHNANGDIKISQWGEDYVEVYAKKKTSHGEEELAKVDIEVVVDDMMKVRTKYLEKDARVSVKYDIKVPKDVVVQEIKTSNGEIEIKGTNGDTRLMTSNGEIYVTDVNGTVSVQTSNGEIEIKRTTAVLEANTSNGEVSVEIYNMPEDGTNISSSNGSIQVYISDELNAGLRAATSIGKVHIKDVELQSRFTATSQTSSVLVGEIGEGGRSINVSTSNGEIRFHRLAE